MTENASRWTVLAHLLRPQGRKGELLAELLTDFPDRFHERKQVFLALPGYESETAPARSAEVISSWLPKGRSEGRVVLQFSGCETITQAEQLAGLDVIVSSSERMPLDEDAAYISELIGCTVYDGPTVVGVVADVQFPATPDGTRRLEEVAPLLEVMSSESDEILVPFAKAFVLKVNLGAKRIEMALPPGLVDVNRTTGPGKPEED